MSNKMDFYQSYENIDIWREFDTVSGKETFTFFWLGQTYEANTAMEIINLAKHCIEKQRGRQRGA